MSFTRDETVALARNLHRQGLKTRDIGAIVGAPRSTVDMWINDPDGAKAKARKERYRPRCLGCSKLLSGSNGRGPKASKRCHQCNGRWLAEEKTEARECVRQCVVTMWKQGWARGQIADAMGWTPKSASVRVAQLRALGYDLPYRRPDAVDWCRRMSREHHGLVPA